MSGKHGTEKQKAGWVLRPLYALLAALQFLTIAPPIVRRPFTVVEMGRAVGYFPLVGALLGGLLPATEDVIARYCTSQQHAGHLELACMSF